MPSVLHSLAAAKDVNALCPVTVSVHLKPAVHVSVTQLYVIGRVVVAVQISIQSESGDSSGKHLTRNQPLFYVSLYICEVCNGESMILSRSISLP